MREDCPGTPGTLWDLSLFQDMPPSRGKLHELPVADGTPQELTFRE